MSNNVINNGLLDRRLFIESLGWIISENDNLSYDLFPNGKIPLGRDYLTTYYKLSMRYDDGLHDFYKIYRCSLEETYKQILFDGKLLSATDLSIVMKMITRENWLDVST